MFCNDDFHSLPAPNCYFNITLMIRFGRDGDHDPPQWLDCGQDKKVAGGSSPKIFDRLIGFWSAVCRYGTYKNMYLGFS